MPGNGKDNMVGGFEGAVRSTETGKHVYPPQDSDLKLDDSAQRLIGQRLKAVYNEIATQPIPDQFLQLLDQLERKETDL
jgi:hypothetical protein